MTREPKPIRRVVTGTDSEGRSCVLFDSAAPQVNRHVSASMTDIWVYHQPQPILSGGRDDGNLAFSFEPPEQGGHFRIVESTGRRPDYNPATDAYVKGRHAPVFNGEGTGYQGGQNAYSSPYHKSKTLDYGILLEGKRTLILDEGEFPLRKTDVVVQLGNWHGWTNPDGDSLMAFVMMGTEFET